MYPLLETIKVVDGIAQNLKLHQARIDYACWKYFDIPARFSIETLDFKIDTSIDTPINSIQKLRLLYNCNNFTYQTQVYTPKPVSTLKIVHDDTISYSLKYANRDCLDALLQHKQECDDILIIKNGLVTDTSFSNIVFFDGQHWITPAQPLLKGTCRANLLIHKRIIEEDIRLDDLQKFQYFKLINAMKDFDDEEARPVSNIMK